MEEEIDESISREQEKVSIWSQEKREEEKPKLKKNPAPKRDRFWKITTVVLIIALAFFLWKGDSSSITGGTAADTADSGDTGTLARDIVKLADDAPFLGDEDAPVVIVEFSDYQCSYCGKFYQETLPQIKSQYIDTGKVKFVYRDFPLSFHQEAEAAAIAVNCALEQGKFWEFQDLIYRNQQSLSRSTYEKLAAELGLDVEEWKVCLTNPQQKAEVQRDLQEGIAAGVQGTPAFFINGKLLSGAQPFSIFQQAIEAELN